MHSCTHKQVVEMTDRLVRGADLRMLQAICEQQKTVSTSRVEAEIERIHDKMKEYAVLIVLQDQALHHAIYWVKQIDSAEEREKFAQWYKEFLGGDLPW